MYGDDDDSGAEDNRPLSFIAAKYGGEHLDKAQNAVDPVCDRLRLVRTTSDQTSSGTHLTPEPNRVNGGSGLRKAQTFPARLASEGNSSNDRPKSPLPPMPPNPSLKDVQNASASQYPLTNIDDPNDIAQELSNLQALRRMSMDVGNTTQDPDLLQFSGVSLREMPSIAPTGDDDEADPSRLLWVPARVHPELEPTAFRNFLEKRVETMKRRSGDSLLSVDGLQRHNSGSLRRKKSMLSRQVHSSTESGEGYADGADKLARQRSLMEPAELSLSELVSDPTKAVQKLSQETRQEGGEGDSPILPMAPGMGLRRSTKTTYRKGGSQRFGERVTVSRRLGSRQAEKDTADEPPPVPPLDPSIGRPLTRVQSEPVTENYSRPTRTVRRQQNFSREAPEVLPLPTAAADETPNDEGANPAISISPPTIEALPVRSVSTSAVHSPPPPVPQIVETPPAEESPQPAQPQEPPQIPSTENYPDRPAVDGPPARSSKRPSPGQPSKVPVPAARASSLKEQGSKQNPLAEINQPHALPGSGGSTTSSLTFIPTFDTVEKKHDKKTREKDDSDSIVSTKSTSSWKWFKSDDKEKKKREKEREKEKEREREREREREEQAKKAKGKTGDKSHDHARMDVLQSSINNVPKSRESLRLDRDSIEALPQEERKKETNRKSSEGKKEREGFFGGLFGGSKKKGDKEGGHKKKDHRPLTPDPPPRPLRPDIDFPWTRFPIIEERAIYRMAHIKLANPRRPLHSQVLLSNFMYSYLAKVQAMHPQLQIPVSPQQKRLEEERKRREAEEAQLQMEQQMLAQQAAQDGNFDFDYHRSGNQYGDAPAQQNGSSHYVDDAQIYEYENGDPQLANDEDGYSEAPAQGHATAQGHGGAQQQQQNNYYHAQGTRRYDDDDQKSDMW
ncbi:hypothetical protein N658DRAFT_424988 [Parathielavia hyrcaniae]|uniref:Protein Zds1 C-terminal domain-containing protein n=1 Tax=Parathielavia hyrcaniae TaxID=113614 RepID=A0AAN6Q2G7_9PEZI|nr:hypothetical protein N658DRAFT_424988 [Parathielavia hyrcaniae]